jgi:hypothetical protein
MHKVVYVGIAAGLAGVIGVESAHLGVQHQKHTTGSTYLSVPASVASDAAFRAMYAEAVEVLADNVSPRLPVAPTTLVMNGDEMRRILEIWRDRLGA